MVTNNNEDGGSHRIEESDAQDGHRSRSRMPWRQGRDSGPATNTRDQEPVRDARDERTLNDRGDRHDSGPMVKDRDGRRDAGRGEVDRRESERGVNDRGVGDRDGRQGVLGRDADRGDVDRGDRRESDRAVVDHESVTRAQKERHGGVKVGSAFFGWLTATGMAVLLTALLAAAGAAVGVGNNTDITKAADTATSNSKTVGIVGAIVLLVIVLVAYYCGGYVAGRMARFNGILQGVAVWVWTLVIAVVLAVLAAAAGQKYNVSATLNIFPRIPVNEGTLTTAGIIALLAVAVAALIGAMLGGLAGMHYHRRVDHTVPVARLTDRLSD